MLKRDAVEHMMSILGKYSAGARTSVVFSFDVVEEALLHQQ